MRLIADGKLTIPLYLGTSILFNDSIREFGLGGRNLIKEFGVIETIREMISICQMNLPREEAWLVRMDDAERISQQCVTKGGFNFRHGSAYLTPSNFTAVNYATTNTCGSEALEHFMMRWNRLREHRIGLPRDVSDAVGRIVRFAERPRVPLLVKLAGVPAAALAAEDGGQPTDVFQRLESLLRERFFSTMCQQTNFELVEPIPVSHADVFRIVEPSCDPEREPTLSSRRSSISSIQSQLVRSASCCKPRTPWRNCLRSTQPQPCHASASDLPPEYVHWQPPTSFPPTAESPSSMWASHADPRRPIPPSFSPHFLRFFHSYSTDTTGKNQNAIML